MKNLGLIVLLAFLFTGSLSAAVNAIPDNQMSNPPLRVKDFEVLNVGDFKFVTDTLYKIYAPIVKARGNVELVFNANWEDPTVNAYATREIGTWTVHINGGMARAKEMTRDSLALIICHELGHHLGGAPRTFLYEGWPSAEGQADYWASSKCLKNYFNELKDEEIAASANIPQKVIEDCTNIYKDLREFKICVRSMLASIDFGRVLNAFPGVKIPVSLETPDPRMVKGTNTNNYPRPQCRFDTLYQGALCDIGSHVATSVDDAKIGHCNDTTKPGSRPRCWYKPQ